MSSSHFNLTSMETTSNMSSIVSSTMSSITSSTSTTLSTFPDSNTTNTSEVGEEDLHVTFLYIFKAIILIVIILVAIFSNLLVIASVFLYRRLRGINNYFLVSLAFADLFVACFAMTFNASQQIFGRWMFGSAVCDIYNSIDVHASTVSTLHLCCISLDRYFAIVKPFDYHYFMNTRSALGMIFAAWLCPCLISFVPILLDWSGNSGIEDESGYCVFKANLPYAFISSFMTFWCPVIVMVIVYYRVYREAVKQKTSMAMTVTVNLPSINGYTSNPPCSNHNMESAELVSQGRTGNLISPSDRESYSGGSESIIQADNGQDDSRRGTGKSNSRQDTSSLKARGSIFLTSGVSMLEGFKERKRLNSSWRKSALKEHKAFVTLGVVMGAFLLCWLPFFIWYLTVTMCGEACPCPESVVTLLFWIGYFNSTLNPVIYAMTNRDFKLAFIGILKKLFCFCRSEQGRRSSDF